VQLQDSGDGGALSLALLPASWSETQGGGDQGRGMFFLRPRVEVDRPMALSAPHPRFDSDSGTVAAMAFRQLRARSLAIAGTHRCANSALSGCSGSTSSCDSESSPYRESDMAHMERAFFQVFHERMDREYDRAIQHIQVHGMGSSADEPEFSISGGVTRDHDDPGFPSNRLASTLGEIVRAAGSSKPANSCNAPGQENMLCGTTNTQGRYTNGVDVAEVCMRSSGGNGVGRFIHAELSRAIRNPAGSLGPQTFVDALALVFPASAPPESSAP